MKVTKLRLPNGIEVEGEFNLEDVARLPAPMPMRVDPAATNWWLCTCPTTWMGVIPPPVCSACTARGIVRPTFPGPSTFTGTIVPNAFSIGGTQTIPNVIIGGPNDEPMPGFVMTCPSTTCAPGASNVTSFSIKLSSDPT